MISTWNWVFTPAVAFGLAGFVALLLNTENMFLFVAGPVAIAVALVYCWLIRPKLGVD